MVTPQGRSSFPPNFVLTNNKVDVWSVSLRQPTDVMERLSCLLSKDEADRADRFQFEHLRNSFIVSRGTLRILLASYLNLEPEQIQFRYEPAGKPQLSEHHGRKFFFNLSHSHDVALYAFSSTRNLGIDIEYVRPIDDLERIADRNFSAIEIMQLKALPPEARLTGFFNCWTRKEAYIKAIGDGVSFPLDQFDVSLKPGELAKILSISGSAQEAERWSMYELQPAVGYVAGLVVEGNGCDISLHEWTPSHSISMPQAST